MDKQTKIGFMFMFLLAVALFISAEVSAIELNPFANSKTFVPELKEDMSDFIKEDFNSKYGVIQLSKTRFWIETDKIAEYSLTENTDQCLINCKSKGKAVLYTDGKLFDDKYFLNKKGIEVEIDSQYYIKEIETYYEDVPQYKEVCSLQEIISNSTIKDTNLLEKPINQEVCNQELIGYEKVEKTKEVWKEYNFEVLKAGEYEWEIRGSKATSQSVDFIPTAHGKSLNEWSWWNSDWKFKKEILIQENSANTLNNYSVELFIEYNSNMNSNFSDLIFTNDVEDTELGYWIENKNDGVNATIWVKVPELTASQNTSIFMYYGNALAESQSNKINSPILFEDEFNTLNTSYWQNTQCWAVTGGYLYYTCTSASTSNQRIWGNQNYSIGGIGLNFSVRIMQTATNTWSFFGYNGIDNVNAIQTARGNEIKIENAQNYYKTINSTRLKQQNVASDSGSYSSYYNYNFLQNKSKILIYKDGSLKYEGSAENIVDSGYLAGGAREDPRTRIDYVILQQYVSPAPTYTIGAEEQIEGASITLNSPADNLQSTSSTINFNATITPRDATIKNVTLYLNDEEYLDLYDTNETINYSKILTLEDGDYTWNITACWIGESLVEDCTESDTRSFSIDATLPNITVTSGDETQPYYYSGINHTVNFTVEDDNLDSGWWRYGEEEMEILDTNLSSNLFDGNFSTGTLLNLDTDLDAQYYILLNKPGGDLNLSTSWCQESWVNCEYHHSDIFSTSMCETNTIIVNITHDDSDWWNAVYFMHFYCGNIYIGNASISSNMLSPKMFSEIQTEGITSSLSGTLNISEDNTYSVTVPVTKDIYDFSIYANDTFGNVASKEINWSYYVYENNVVYNPTATEGKIEDFVFSLTTTSEITAAIFNYDGVRSSANIYSSGTNKTISINDYEIPSIETDKNITFFLELTLTGGIKINSTSYIQSVKNLGFDDCSSNTFPLMNMSLYDEKAKTPLTGTIEVNYWIENALFTNKIATYNNTFSSTSSKRICSNVNLSGQGLYQSAIIRYSATGYVPEFYNVQRAEVDGIQYIKLYDLNESDSTEFLVTYYNDNFIKVSGAILQLLRGYIDKDIYEVVEAPLTSSEGTAIVHVDTKTNLYKAILVKDGVILNTFNDLVFACESPLVTQCEMKLSGKVEPSTSIDTADLQDISYEISTINNTVNFLFSIPSGVTSSVNLIMEQTDSFGTTQLCNKIVSSAGGTIECDFDDTIGESYVTLYVYKDETPIVHKQYAIMEDSPLKFLGNNFFIVFIMLLSVVGMAFSSPEWIIINASVTLLISGSLWLLNGMDFVIGIGAIMWLLVGAIILISKLAKQEDR